MKTLKKNITLLIFLLPLFSFSQKVENIRFEQAGKEIHIYYDLEGDETYTVQVFCSTDNGQSWGEPLKYVAGAVGENQIPGKGKMVVWDVLSEREKLSGDIRFKLKVSLGNIGTFTDNRDGQTYKWVKIGKQVWMSENLNHKKVDSWCYNNTASKCNQYGRLYNWEAAKDACPNGWHSNRCPARRRACRCVRLRVPTRHRRLSSRRWTPRRKPCRAPPIRSRANPDQS